MRYMFMALIQSGNGEETTTSIGDKVKDTGRDAVTIFKVINGFVTDVFEYLTSTDFISNVIASVLVILLGIFAYRILTHGVPRVLRWRRRGGEDLLDAEAIARIKRQDTAITLIRNGLRYVIFAVIVLFVLSIFVRDPLPAAAGATVLAAVLGFGAQSLLRDIIAGFSIIFEGQYSVGDFIEVHPPQGVGGIVEDLGLRMTKIRALSGEIHYIPNGMIQGVTNYVSGQQRFTVEVQLSDPEAVQRVVDSLDEASSLYLRTPQVVSREEMDGRTRLRIVAGVLPSMAWLVEDNLVQRIKAAAGEEALASEPLIYKVDQANLSRIRSLIPEEKEQNEH